jgi:DNA polymerase IIIc chi subunit
MASCIFHETSAAAHERQLFEIVEQAYSQRRKVLVFTQDEARASAIDRTLWILKQEAFIPHKIFAVNEADFDVCVAIVSSEMNPISADVLVVDAHCRLDFACEFDSIHEFVDRSSPETHQACRDRFRDYRLRQIPVEYSK